MRIMGLDVGEKRIGIAISDPLGLTAQPHSVLVRTGLAHDLNHIQQLCELLEVERLVAGLPLNMNGSVGPKAQEVQEFAGLVSDYTGKPMDFWDERLSTVSAERVLISADISRSKRKKYIDKIAAVYILQGYLDNKRPGNT